jgi:trk system potassium uptake protein
MFVLIAGGGRTAAQLGTLLLAQGHRVKVIEHRADVLAAVHQELPTEVVHEGNATDPRVLVEAGIGEAQVLAACMPNDADNLVLCYLARERYGVSRTIGQISNPRNAWLFDELFHVDVALNQADVLASLIEEEMSLGDMMTLLKLRRGAYSLVEEKIPPGARAVGVAIKDLGLPGQCTIAAIIRHGKLLVPQGTTEMQVGDEVLAVTDRHGAEALAALFGRPDAVGGASSTASTTGKPPGPPTG